MISFKIWVKTIPPAMLAVVVVTFVVLNMNTIIEPKVNVVFAQYERPGLMPVLVGATLAGVAIGLLVRTVFETARRFRQNFFLVPTPTTRSRLRARPVRKAVIIQNLANDDAVRAAKDGNGRTQD